jgi:hypothetical protein
MMPREGGSWETGISGCSTRTRASIAIAQIDRPASQALMMSSVFTTSLHRQRNGAWKSDVLHLSDLQDMVV